LKAEILSRSFAFLGSSVKFRAMRGQEGHYEQLVGGLLQEELKAKE
jgi:hypothetical protein